MKIYQIPVSQQQLNSIPYDERLFLVQIGHLANELATLNRLLLFVSNTTASTEVEMRARNSQALLLVRLCCGKLFEGWQMLQRDYFGSKLSKDYDNLMDANGKNSLNQIKRYFSRNNLIKEIRDNFAFHYSAEDLQNHLLRTDPTGMLYMYLGTSHGNSFYSFADLLVGSAMLSKVPGADPQRAMDVLFEDPVTGIKWFLDFIGSCMIILGEKYLGGTLEDLGATAIEVPNTINWRDVCVPFFLAEEN